MESIKSAIEWGKDNGMFKFVTVMSLVAILAILVAATLRNQIARCPVVTETRVDVVQHRVDVVQHDVDGRVNVFVVTDKKTSTDVLVIETSAGVTSQVLPTTPAE